MASPYTCDMDRDRRHLVSLAIMAASFAAVLVLAPLRPGGWLEIATWCFFVSLPFAAAYPIVLQITRYGGYQPADMPSITLAVAADHLHRRDGRPGAARDLRTVLVLRHDAGSGRCHHSHYQKLAGTTRAHLADFETLHLEFRMGA